VLLGNAVQNYQVKPDKKGLIIRKKRRATLSRAVVKWRAVVNWAIKTSRIIAVLFAVVLAPLIAHATISIDTVTVGNPGNANDSTGFGGVSYTYNIGTYDVSLLQYASFLNAVAATDTYSLWNPNLATDMNVAGISRSGISGSYTYSVIGDGNRPVTYVSWFDAARFTNWLDNGQPTGAQGPGTTETGAYTLNGAMSGVNFTRNAGFTWVIPSENEWYKAADYDPSLNGGSGGYWLYPTRSNSVPGNVVGSSPNQANFNNGVYSVTQSSSYSSSQNYLTPGGAYSGSASAYGTYDQGGDVFQWDEAVIASARGLRGGSWNDAAFNMRSSSRNNNDPTLEAHTLGFRVAEAVPEPSTVAASLLLAACLVGFEIRRRRIRFT
jgi:sulfatase modifying factor 1